jgi:uncharacterized protein YPO0396
MKLLQKIRLINWHRFTNETIELGNACLISGENGAGKSTILDAIQLVITASKNNFNKAAHDKGKRTLNTYVRCKTGREDKPYERSGAISAHVALEFLDEARSQSFIIGCVMDSATEEREPNIAWYLIEKRELKDEMFFDGKQVRSMSSFRSFNKSIKTWATTQKMAQSMALGRFGRLEDKFFTLIPKALAFKPISDIKEFVYTYVLDQKDVNIDALRENVRSYQDLSRTLEDVRKRIQELEQIIAKEEQVENCNRIDRYQEFYLARASEDLILARIESVKNTLQKEAFHTKDLERQQTELIQTIQREDETINALSVELGSNAEYQAYLALEKREDELKSRIEIDRQGTKELLDKARIAAKIMERLSGETDITGAPDAFLQEYAAGISALKEQEDLVKMRDLLEQVLSYKKEQTTRLQQMSAREQLRMQEMESRRKELSMEISSLEKRQLVYPMEVIRLRTAIEQKLTQAGRPEEVRILCEQLEIRDPAWQNAVEGYLNTQRFYLLVSPESFDLSANVYDRLRRDGKAYGVGLINAAKLEQYGEAPEGSLAEKVETGNVYARRYINMVLGKVHCVSQVEELKQYPVSITKNCMRYQNHVVSAIPPKTFATPYIGARAYEIQLAKKREEREELDKQHKASENVLKHQRKVLEYLDVQADLDVKYRLGTLEQLRSDEAALKKIRADLEAIGADKTLLEKKIRLGELKEEKKKLDQDRDRISQQIGSSRQHQESLTESITGLSEDAAEKQKVAAALLLRFGAVGPEMENSYQKELLHRSSIQTFITGFENARKANETRKNQFVKEMEELMHAYKVSHDFGGAATEEGFPEYKAEYIRLRDSRLLDYEEKVAKARKASEEEFREQFLSKLQENIKQAQNEFRSLNQALKEIHFAHERYEFLHMPKASEKKYYDMIMDDFNVMEGTSIFSGLFNEAHREVIEELFEKLSLDDESGQETLEQYTDYRFYMDYDIRITNDDGSFMYYSKVAREKSGGETQTPFYITVAASFMQLYRNSIGGDSVGLVLMDEAFNNMDDERIQGVLSFMRSADLQLIISAPPEKIQYIGPAMDKVLLVMTDGSQSYVEDFSRES